VREEGESKFEEDKNEKPSIGVHNPYSTRKRLARYAIWRAEVVSTSVDEVKNAGLVSRRGLLRWVGRSQRR